MPGPSPSSHTCILHKQTPSKRSLAKSFGFLETSGAVFICRGERDAHVKKREFYELNIHKSFSVCLKKKENIQIYDHRISIVGAFCWSMSVGGSITQDSSGDRTLLIKQHLLNRNDSQRSLTTVYNFFQVSGDAKFLKIKMKQLSNVPPEFNVLLS